MAFLIGCGDQSFTRTADSQANGEASAETKTQAASSSPTITRKTATARGNKKISYRVVGSGSTDIVLVHGWMTSGTVWDNLIPKLASSDYRLLIPDLRGTAPSDQPNGGYSIENYLKDVLAVTKDAGAKSFILAGHSMGGAIAQKLAGKRPNKLDGLILMSPVPASGFALPQATYKFFRSAADSPALQRQIFRISSVDMDKSDVDRLVSSSSAMPPKAIRQSLDAWVDADFEDQLSNITAPTYILVSDDPFMNQAFLKQKIASKVSNAQVDYFPGAGHYLFVEKPQATADKLNGFIDTLP
jgi:pimeloyl-ACP methyl ester carboxylesterase